MAEWQSDRGSLTRRVLQGQGDSPFSFPSAFPFLIRLSSEPPPVPRLHSDHLFVFFTSIGPLVFGHLWDTFIPAPLVQLSVTACTVFSLLDTVNNHPRDDATLLYRLCSRQSIRYSLQSSKECGF